MARLVQFDTNCDGKADYSFVTPDDASKPISAQIDSNFDGKTDISVEDRDRNGTWDISFHDVDFDGKIDLVGYHADGKLAPTRFGNTFQATSTEWSTISISWQFYMSNEIPSPWYKRWQIRLTGTAACCAAIVGFLNQAENIWSTGRSVLPDWVVSRYEQDDPNDYKLSQLLFSQNISRKFLDEYFGRAAGESDLGLGPQGVGKLLYYENSQLIFCVIYAKNGSVAGYSASLKRVPRFLRATLEDIPINSTSETLSNLSRDFDGYPAFVLAPGSPLNPSKSASIIAVLSITINGRREYGATFVFAKDPACAKQETVFIGPKIAKFEDLKCKNSDATGRLVALTRLYPGFEDSFLLRNADPIMNAAYAQQMIMYYASSESSFLDRGLINAR